MNRKAVLIFITLLFTFALSACGSSSGGGGGGVSGGGVSNVPRFAYVANQLDNSVSMYTVNASTGQLRHHGYVAAGTGPVSVTVDASGKFAYVANYISNNISAYSLNASTGALTAVAGSPFAAGTWPNSVTTTGIIQ